MSVLMLSISTSLMIATCCPDGLMKRTDFIKTIDGKRSRKWHFHPCSLFPQMPFGPYLCSKARHWGNSSLLKLSQNLNWTVTLSQPKSLRTSELLKMLCMESQRPGGHYSHLGALLSGAGLAPVSYNHSSQVSSSSFCSWRFSCFSHCTCITTLKLITFNIKRCVLCAKTCFSVYNGPHS